MRIRDSDGRRVPAYGEPDSETKPVDHLPEGVEFSVIGEFGDFIGIEDLVGDTIYVRKEDVETVY